MSAREIGSAADARSVAGNGDHDNLCPLSEPCDDETPEHGYCSMQHGVYCIHCMQWCICEALAKADARARADEREKAAQRVSDVQGEWSIADQTVAPYFDAAFSQVIAAVRGES